MGARVRAPLSKEARETQAAFFDHFLNGADNGWEHRPPVRLAIYERGSHPAQVTQETQWPPEDLTWQTLHLDAASHSLTPSEPNLATCAAFDIRGPGLHFTWTVPQDLDLIGPSALRLFLEVDHPARAHLPRPQTPQPGRDRRGARRAAAARQLGYGPKISSASTCAGPGTTPETRSQDSSPAVTAPAAQVKPGCTQDPRTPPG